MNLPVLQECKPYNAKLLPSACIARWRMSQRDVNMAETWLGCRTCEVGKRNAQGTAEDFGDNARDCAVCGTKFKPQAFTAWQRTCSKPCRAKLMSETKAKNNAKSCVRIKKQREAKKAVTL